MNSIYKNFGIFFISAPLLLLSTGINADGESESNTSTDMKSNVREESGASAYNRDDDTGASAYHYVDNYKRFKNELKKIED